MDRAGYVAAKEIPDILAQLSCFAVARLLAMKVFWTVLLMGMVLGE
jgi:hypothetical protein